MPIPNEKIVRVGTRSSLLARLQTDLVVRQLCQNFPEIKFAVVTISTSGDKQLDKPIAELNIQGVFVKELEEALLSDKVDLVVHSMKDLPTCLPSGLTLAAVAHREDPRDVLISHNNVSFSELPSATKVATSSRRRIAMLQALRNDLSFIDMRGNIPTRIQKFDFGHCDAMVLAAAGLLRLGMNQRITEFFDPEIMTPAAGQGALGTECRVEDKHIVSLLNSINDPVIRAQITAERSFLDQLGGGCSVPIGALATMTETGLLHLRGYIASADGAKTFRSQATAPLSQADDLGVNLAKQMLSREARSVLADLKQTVSNIVSPP